MLWYIFSILHLLCQLRAGWAAGDAIPGCPDTCGNITVPYPFGLTSGCYAPGFFMTCNNTYSPPKLFVGRGNLEIAGISPENVIMKGWIARYCNDETNPPYHAWIDLRGTPYTFSYTRNRFTVVGCNAIALIYRTNRTDYTSGCITLCQNEDSLTNGTCSGIGCCQTAIPRGLKRFDTMLRSFVSSLSPSNSFSPCSYGFMIDQQEYEFSLGDLVGLRYRSRVPVVLDWAVGNQTCAEARAAGTLLCGGNSSCSASANGPGYRCSCSKGFQGNPYLANGCQDINECQDPNLNDCSDICTNNVGGYQCSCPHDSTGGDGRKDGSRCIRPPKPFPIIQVVLGCGFGFLFLLVTSSLLYWSLKKKRLIHLREIFFEQNGGLLLQEEISSHEGAAETAKIFTAQELRKATNNYSPARIIGKGGSGTVYRGILPDGRVVAIKKSRIVDETQIDQFINEVVILSQVIHRNVVKIIGCCLETQVPLLVYEYIPSGSLSDRLHGEGNFGTLSWEARLRIGAETAGALAYLHSATARPIIHRDVKCANILLDQNYTTKVADFGASRLIPLNRAHLTTLVQGTLGYLDPEYFHTGQLTEKSDVYSFGVVLVELLTGKMPVSTRRPEEERYLAMHFILSLERGQLDQILEPRVRNEGERGQLVEVAQLAERCLKVTGEERPAMKEVADELERARRFHVHPWAEEEEDIEEEAGMLLAAAGLSRSSSSASSYASAANQSGRLNSMSSVVGDL